MVEKSFGYQAVGIDAAVSASPDDIDQANGSHAHELAQNGNGQSYKK